MRLQMTLSQIRRTCFLAATLAGACGFLARVEAQPPFGGFGGFGGGPPMMMGGERGGDRGGDRGGERGGERGGFRGGGFDPSSFLSRMDQNGNGMLDPDEMQGPARFMLERMASSNPNISLSRPIPLSTITSEFEKMRGGGGSSWGGSSWGSSSSGDDAAIKEVVLVPDFKFTKVLNPPKGFGPKADAPPIKVEDVDMSEAEERVRRYDRNSDRVLDEDEIKAGRWSDDPMKYDRNGDKRLTVEELAVRYANRRAAESQQNSFQSQSRGPDPSRDRRRDDRSQEKSPEVKEEETPLREKVASYRSTPKDSAVAGVPKQFTDRDRNADGQLTQNEFGAMGDDAKIEEFLKFDLNSDGYITSKECITAIKNGILFSGSSDSSSAPSSSTTASSSGTTSPAGGGGMLSRDGIPADAKASMVEWCEKAMIKIDGNKSGTLTPDEFSASEGDFKVVDSSGDGQISLAEYYHFRMSKYKK